MSLFKISCDFVLESGMKMKNFFWRKCGCWFSGSLWVWLWIYVMVDWGWVRWVM